MENNVSAIDSKLAELEGDYGPEIAERVKLKVNYDSQIHDIEAALRKVLLDKDKANREQLLILSEVPCASRAAGLDLESLDAASRRSRIERILNHDAQLRASGGPQ